MLDPRISFIGPERQLYSPVRLFPKSKQASLGSWLKGGRKRVLVLETLSQGDQGNYPSLFDNQGQLKAFTCKISLHETTQSLVTVRLERKPCEEEKRLCTFEQEELLAFLCSKSFTYKSCKRDCHFFITDTFNTSTKRLQSLSGLEKRKWDKNDKRKTAVLFSLVFGVFSYYRDVIISFNCVVITLLHFFY